MLVHLKKTIYIIAFAVLGFLAQLLVHAAIELPTLALIVDGSEIRGFSWDTWKTIHRVGAIGLLIAGLSIGVQQGFYWWPKLYDAQGLVRRARRRR